MGPETETFLEFLFLVLIYEFMNLDRYTIYNCKFYPIIYEKQQSVTFFKSCIQASVLISCPATACPG